MAEATDLRNISKFNGQNFQIWKFQMRTVFVAHDLLEIVEGTEVKPEDTEANADTRKNWTKKNAKAMFVLSSSMEYPQLEYLITCSTAHEMWQKLSGIHEQKSASNKLTLTTKFHDYRMGLNDSIAQHFAKVENLVNQLKDIEESVSDIMIMAKIISALPAKYNAFVSAWDSVSYENQTLNNLRERLLREEARMTTTDDIASALATIYIIIMSNEERPYYIVEFSDGIQLIPHNWFNPSKNKAYWPNFINITKYDKAVRNMQPVGEDWNLYDVIKIFGSAQSFESGKRKLKLAETISDLNTDVSDEEKSKKERRRKAAKTFDTDSDTDSDSQIIESLLEPFPIINANQVKTVNTIIDSKFKNLQKIDNQFASTSFQSNDGILPSEFSITSKKQKRDEIPALNSKNKKMKKNNIEKDFENDKENLQLCVSTEEQEFQKFMVKNMMHTKMGLKRCENILTDILTILKTSNLSRTEDHSTFINDTLDELPIKDSESLQKIEYLLKTNESYKNSLIKMLSMVGGNDLKSVTINILTRTLTNSAASEYSWLGGKKKLVFSNLYLWKIILGVVRRHIPHAVESDISKHIKIWLAHATERLQREEKKNKSLESVSIEKQMGTAIEIALQNDMIISS